MPSMLSWCYGVPWKQVPSKPKPMRWIVFSQEDHESGRTVTARVGVAIGCCSVAPSVRPRLSAATGSILATRRNGSFGLAISLDINFPAWHRGEQIGDDRSGGAH